MQPNEQKDGRFIEVRLRIWAGAEQLMLYHRACWPHLRTKPLSAQTLVVYWRREANDSLVSGLQASSADWLVKALTKSGAWPLRPRSRQSGLVGPLVHRSGWSTGLVGPLVHWSISRLVLG